jgi:hypothetical protein
VRRNEDLYRDLEVKWTLSFKLGKPKVIHPNAIRVQEENARCVLQGDLIYLKVEGSSATIDGQTISCNTLQGFDGQRTLIYEQDAVGNLRPGRVESFRLFRPHTLPLRRAFVQFPLSIYLQGDDAIASHPNGRTYSDIHLEPKYVGVEIVQGMACSKILIETWTKGGGKLLEDAKWFLWLAHDRNYLPIKVEAYKISKSLKRPMQQSLLSDLREIAPDVWFPFAATTICNDPDTLHEAKGSVAWKDEYRVQQASLNPKYDISLFRDIQFPSGTYVYDVDGDRIIGERVVGKPKPTSGRQVLMWLGIALGLGILLIMLCRIHQKRKSKGIDQRR